MNEIQNVTKENLRNFELKYSIINESFKENINQKDNNIESLKEEVTNLRNKLNISDLKCQNLEIEKENVKSEIITLIERQLEVDYNEKFLKSKN